MTQRDSKLWPLRCRCSALTNWATKSHSWEPSWGFLNFQLTNTTTWLWRWLLHRLSKRQSPTKSFSGLQSPRRSFFNQGIANIAVYKFDFKKRHYKSGTSVTFHSWRIWPLAEQRNRTSCIRPSKPPLSDECFCKRQNKTMGNMKLDRIQQHVCKK